MKHFLEKMSLLALSSMLISTYSISAVLPFMLEHFQAYPADQVELLISIPSFMIMVMLLGNRLLHRYLTEARILIVGLLILGLAGMVPLFVQEYPLVLFSRLLLGVGVGLINAKAISIISERYHGQERIQMQGYRGAAEVVGSAFLTVLVGCLLPLGWPFAFAIYAFAFLVLLLYLLFVPKIAEPSSPASSVQRVASKLSKKQWFQSLFLAGLAACGVFVNTVVSLRTPIMVTGLGLGTATDASLILSGQQLLGIVAGVLFGRLLGKWGKKLASLSCLGLGLCYLGMGLATSLPLLAISTIATGFCYSLMMTLIFYQISDWIPSPLINTATAIVLLGCNIGSAFSPYILKGLGFFTTSNHQIFLLLAGLMGILAIAIVKPLTQSEAEEEEESHALG